MTNNNKKINLSKIKLISLFITLFIFALIILFLPYSVTTCGALADGDQCEKRTCLGPYIVDDNIPPSSKCMLIDLGTENYFKPNKFFEKINGL